MTSQRKEKLFNNVKPQHQVSLSKSFQRSNCDNNWRKGCSSQNNDQHYFPQLNSLSWPTLARFTNLLRELPHAVPDHVPKTVTRLNQQRLREALSAAHTEMAGFSVSANGAVSQWFEQNLWTEFIKSVPRLNLPVSQPLLFELCTFLSETCSHCRPRLDRSATAIITTYILGLFETVTFGSQSHSILLLSLTRLVTRHPDLLSNQHLHDIVLVCIKAVEFPCSEDAPLLRLHAVQGLVNLCWLESNNSLSTSDIVLQREDPLPNALANKILRCLLFVAVQKRPDYLELDRFTRVLLLCAHGINFLLARCPPLDVLQLQECMVCLRTFMAWGVLRNTASNLVVPFEAKFFADIQDDTCVTIQPITLSKPGGPRRNPKRPVGPCALRSEQNRSNLADRIQQLALEDSSHIDLINDADIELSDENGPMRSASSYLSTLTDSDSDGGLTDLNERNAVIGVDRRVHSIELKLRFVAACAMKQLIEMTQKRVMHNYWLLLFPDTSVCGGGLLNLVMKEPNFKVRITQISVITAMLTGSRMFLTMAEDSSSAIAASAFIPLAYRLAASLREMHRHLCLALLAEKVSSCQLHLLKCFSTLITNVSYQRLRPGLLSKVVRIVTPFLRHEVADVRTAALSCLGAVGSLEGPLFEVCQCLTHSPRSMEQTSTSLNMSGCTSNSGLATPLLGDLQPGNSNFESSWLVRHCLRTAHPRGIQWHTGWEDVDEMPTLLNADQQQLQRIQPTPVRVEALQTLRALTQHYTAFVRPCAVELCNTLLLCAADHENHMLQNHAIKLLGTAILAFSSPSTTKESSNVVKFEGENFLDQGVDINRELEFNLPEDCARLWKESFPILISCMQMGTHYSVRSVAAECLALLSDCAVRQLLGSSLETDSPETDEERSRMACITVMLGLCCDPEAYVRMAALRTLGHWVNLKTLNQRAGFLADVVEAALRLTSTADKQSDVQQSLAVRHQASWCLANASDCLARQKNSLPAEFNLDKLCHLLECALLMSSDSVRVRENAARILGNLLSLLHVPTTNVSGTLFESTSGKSDPLEQKCSDTLVLMLKPQGSPGAAKVRWNAAYACGQALSNLELPVDAKWREKLLKALCHAMEHDKYLKVKIHASSSVLLAVEIVTNLNLSASILCSILNVVLRTFYSAKRDTPQFSEIRHRDHLLILLCSLVLQLASAMLMQSENQDVLHKCYDMLVNVISEGSEISLSRAEDGKPFLWNIIEETILHNCHACKEINKELREPHERLLNALNITRVVLEKFDKLNVREGNTFVYMLKQLIKDVDDCIPVADVHNNEPQSALMESLLVPPPGPGIMSAFVQTYD